MARTVSKRIRIDKALTNAGRSALNKIIRKAKTATSRRVREVYNIKAKDLNQYIKVFRATNSNLEATLMITGKRIPLHLFGMRKSSRGVSVLVKKTSGRKIVAHAFTNEKLGEGIWKRKGKPRFPVRRLKTLSAPKMYEQEAVIVFEKLTKEELGKTMKHELTYYLSKIG